ncbi:hypothetical protein ElyMa_004314800 [Elysia marginata]|uniref:Peptidase A2 domain-containing protein n=1 Tax=Elysia marginata TaxID=1093978 RepID=A0AAV4GZP6_9GAST|nr:hypothetical protein ElyMa_004314800 [Elysia marginata]
MVNVNLDSLPVKMELDTRSTLSLITIKDYKEVFGNRPSLASTPVKLKTYSGEIIHPLGKTVVNITTPTQNTKQDLYILEKGSKPIFGRDWLSQVTMKWEGLHQQIHKVGLDAESNTATLKEKFKDLFSGGIGQVKSVSASLEVNSDATPKFFKARAVPFANKPKV